MGVRGELEGYGRGGREGRTDVLQTKSSADVTTEMIEDRLSVQ